MLERKIQFFILPLVVAVFVSAPCEAEAHVITILSPAEGSIHTGGVVHFNYTISPRCPDNAFINFYIDGEQIGGHDALFWCQPFIWHGISGIHSGSHTATFVLRSEVEGSALAHSEVAFFVQEGHGRGGGRYFEIRPYMLIDAAPTGAFFRGPRNNSAVVPGGFEGEVEIELVAVNFIPGQHGYAFRLFSVGANGAVSELLETHETTLHLSFPPGLNCLEVVAVSASGLEYGAPDRLCVRVLPAPNAHLSCPDAALLLAGPSSRTGLVIDDQECSVSGALAEACAHCHLVLCAPWDIGLPRGEEEDWDWNASRADYQAAIQSKLRRVKVSEVPAFESQTLDFLFVKHLRLASAVDQQAELESILGLAWSLVRPGGIIGVMSEQGQIIVVSDADGNLFEAYADYGYSLRKTAQMQGALEVHPEQCAIPEWGSPQATFTMKPLRAAPPSEEEARGFVELQGEWEDAEEEGPKPGEDEDPELAEFHDGVLKGKQGEARGRGLQGVSHIYVVHFEPLVERRQYLESVFFETWGLAKETVSFVTWCDSRRTSQAVIDSYYQPTNECLAQRLSNASLLDHARSPTQNSEEMLGFKLKKAQLCTAISHFDALQDMVAQGHDTALILEDDAVFDEDFPVRIQELRLLLDPDWGVVFTDAATSCHWWERCADLPSKRPVPSAFRRFLPAGAFGGAILWNQRAARQLVSTFKPFCLPWDMEIEYHYKIHNTSIFFASPSLIVQGSFLNPGELGFTPSSLLGERDNAFKSKQDQLLKERESLQLKAGVDANGEKPRAAAAADGGVGGGGGAECTDFSFFDCTATGEWDACLAMRDKCGGD